MPNLRDVMDIEYIDGDATQPIGDGPIICAHGVNDQNCWGAGFVLAVSKRWPVAEQRYRRWFQDRPTPAIGEVQFVPVQHAPTWIWVANMITQTLGTAHPLSYPGLERCLQTVTSFATLKGASVHMPRVGCSLGGGSWRKVEPLIQETLCDKGVRVYVYDFPGGRFNP